MLDRVKSKRPSLQWPLHALGLHRPDTQTSERERAALTQHARGRSALAEIGVYQGATTVCLSSAMDPAGVLFAIDPYVGNRFGVDFCFLIARREVARRGVGRVEWVRATGAEAVHDPRLAGRSIDFLFIDGDHSYEGLREDWEAWRPLLQSGAVVGFHDTIGGKFGCQRYMEEEILTDASVEVIDRIDSLTMIRFDG
jgi:predicted O-methyltransferase YrrM